MTEVDEQTEVTTVTGIYEPTDPSGGGYLRSLDVDLRPQGADVFVPAPVARAGRLHGGECVEGVLLAASARQRGAGGPQLATIRRVGDLALEDHIHVTPFENLTRVDPDRCLTVSTSGGPFAMRLVDLLTPIGFGQRALIAAPPRTGKTILLQQLAHAATQNHPQLELFVVLVDERPEEVTDMKRSLPGCVLASSNDRDAASHVRLVELVVAHAKRRVENGEDVLVILDSLTRLARALNAEVREVGRVLTGGFNPRAFERAHEIFSSARRSEEGGSLTIVATALVETESELDEAVFAEFQEAGNMKLVLSRELAEGRTWPAVDLSSAGTRREELLLADEALAVGRELRGLLEDQPLAKSTKAIYERMREFEDNSKLVKALA